MTERGHFLEFEDLNLLDSFFYQQTNIAVQEIAGKANEKFLCHVVANHRGPI